MERHLHFSAMQAIWLVVFFIVFMNLAKYLATRYHVDGLSELVIAA